MAGVAQDQVLLQLEPDPGVQLEGLDDDTVAVMELHVVEAADGGAVLVLLAADNADLMLQTAREVGDLEPAEIVSAVCGCRGPEPVEQPQQGDAE